MQEQDKDIQEMLDVIKNKNNVYIEKIENADEFAKFCDQLLGSIGTITPIKNFDLNILKVRILQASAKEVENIFPVILGHIVEYKNKDLYPIDFCQTNDFLRDIVKFLSSITITGAEIHYMSYLAFVQSALMLTVSAVEIYLRDKLEYEIQKDKRILLQFRGGEGGEDKKKIELKRILDVGLNTTDNTLNITDNIGMLIVENKDFQKPRDVSKLYTKAFGNKFRLFDEVKFKNLEKIFAIRNVMTHRGGTIDQEFINKFENGNKLLDFELNIPKIGERLFLKMEDILKIIDFVEIIITDVDCRIADR